RGPAELSVHAAMGASDADISDHARPNPPSEAVSTSARPAPLARREQAAPVGSSAQPLASRNQVPAPLAVEPEPKQPTRHVPDPTPSAPTLRVTSSGTAPSADATGTTAGASRQPQPADAAETHKQVMALIAANRLVEARTILNTLLIEKGRTLAPGRAQWVRGQLASINQTLIWSPKVVRGDPLVEVHTVAPGDLLVRVAPRYKVPYQLIEQVNRVNARRIRVGQKLKFIKGPFHAVIYKSAYRMDLFLDGPDGRRVYVTSFPVGLGEGDSTPVGSWIVARGRKTVNPDWRNPRTGKYFAADDPKNPIGEYWIGLKGADESTQDLAGYGLHGTIEPETIGTESSMGCVRLRPGHIKTIFNTLAEGHSTVLIVP
ncbi:MAG: L,D-transpeptidase family protein, partial [Phycisphaeraceae bacterium]